MADREADLDKQIESGPDLPMLLDDSFDKPLRRAGAFHAIAIDRPCFVAACIGQPDRVPGRRINRMLDRKDELTAGNECLVYRRQQPVQILDVMQRKRAVGQIEGRFRQVEDFQI